MFRLSWMGALCLALLAVSPAAAAPRVALVIGNGAYQYAPRLANPKNDASDVAATLREIGFDVVARQDADLVSFRNAVAEFRRKLVGAELAVVYYAGHGMQVEGKNFLVPVDAQLTERADVPWQTVNLDLVLDSLDHETRPNIIFLDACRDNPFANVLLASSRSASTRGLSPTGANGTLIAFSTKPDAVAIDGDGRNSPFTSSLLRHIRTPGLEVRQLLTRVRRDVMDATGKRQQPWENSALNGDVYFVPLAATETVAGLTRRDGGEASSFELAFWSSAERLKSKEGYSAYLERFGQNAAFAPLARERLARLDRIDLPAAARPVVDVPVQVKAPAPVASAKPPADPVVQAPAPKTAAPALAPKPSEAAAPQSAPAAKAAPAARVETTPAALSAAAEPRPAGTPSAAPPGDGKGGGTPAGATGPRFTALPADAADTAAKPVTEPARPSAARNDPAPSVDPPVLIAPAAKPAESEKTVLVASRDPAAPLKPSVEPKPVPAPAATVSLPADSSSLSKLPGQDTARAGTDLPEPAALDTLTGRSNIGTAEDSPPRSPAQGAEFVAAFREELEKRGCLKADGDGGWNPSAKRALSRLARQAKLGGVDPERLDEATLNLIRQPSVPFCSCQPGSRLQGGACVPTTAKGKDRQKVARQPAAEEEAPAVNAQPSATPRKKGRRPAVEEAAPAPVKRTRHVSRPAEVERPVVVRPRGPRLAPRPIRQAAPIIRPKPRFYRSFGGGGGGGGGGFSPSAVDVGAARSFERF